MTGGKTPPGVGDDADAARAAIDEKQRKEEHWRRSGALAVEEDNAPRGSRKPAQGEERPPSPLE